MRILRHVVGAFHGAVLAADTLVIEMAHNSGFGMLIVSENRATLEAGGFKAMMASGGDRLQIRLSGFGAGNQSDVAPGFVLLKSIQRMASTDTSLAAGADVEIDGKRVLLLPCRQRGGD